jgi:hypothetical protein
MKPDAPTQTSAWRDDARLATAMTWIAAVIAVIVALAGPTGFFWLSYDAQVKEGTVAARLHSAFVTQVISTSPGDWSQSVSGLIETDLAPSALPEVRTIRDATGTTIASSGGTISGPLLVRTAPLIGPEGIVGEVVVTRSLRPIVMQTLIVLCFSLTLGVAIYTSLRVLPLRALRRSIGALQREEAKAREEAEEHLRIVFEHSI